MATKKQTSKKILSFLLAVVMLVGIAQIPMFANINAEAATEYKVGDIVEFGSYPQSRVTDARIATKLNGLEKTWVSYGYYSGDGRFGESTVKGDWMEYADVEYNGEKYRAVYFSYYRPAQTIWGLTDEAIHYQEKNGYYYNTIYWFKYEPIKWRVIDPVSGLVLSELAIDSQPYQNTIYSSKGVFYSDPDCTNFASDYATSAIRNWLKDEFYNTAFTEIEKDEINETVCENVGVDSTVDKLFLLSVNEFNTYNLKGIACKATDYAKSQGISVENNECSWFLRTIDFDYNDLSAIIVFDGAAYSDEYALSHPVFVTDDGIRPAMVLDSVKHKHSYTSKVTTEPTCTKTGVKTFTCLCGDKYTESIPVIDHSYNKTTITKNPTCVETGIKTFSCVCGKFYTKTLPVVEHKAGNWTVTVEPTLEAEGKKVKKCTVCKDILEEDVVPKLSPADFISVSVDNVAMNYKSTMALNAKFGKLDGVDYTVKYESSNADIVAVDEEGNLTANERGTATITCTITDEFGNTEKDTCTVEVTFAWWQWIIYILLLGFIWY